MAKGYKAIKVQKGTKFRYNIADGNPMWVVTKKVGKDTWEAVCKDEDYGGTVKAFFTEEIEKSIGFDEFWKQKGDESDAFFDSLKEGQTIHYCNGFKEFVECVVVKKDGKNQLKPVALKGEWRKWDLPSRQPDGTIHLGYHVEQIQKGECWRPHASCVLEYPESGYHKHMAEVKMMPRINLDLPEETERQKEIKQIMDVLNHVHKSVEDWQTTLYQDKDSFLVGIRQNIASMLREAASKVE